ncbi:hypothetical protein GGR56DRAFT_645258 [Xylariaceae sp. FL0804]|nr:hypothetical protein GGR56DRAFT_645258 [Xylariaceae sp. FL0804]
MTDQHKEPIVFYDIASREPRTTFAANPWKTRLAFNLKGVAYRTEWVEMPDITAVRERLGVPANRTLPDGTPYQTLPAIQDPATGALVGDSFEIALYLDRAYPGRPRLLRPGTAGLTAALNAHVDGLFTRFAGLCTRMPFDPAVLGRVQDMFAKRMPAIQAQQQARQQPAPSLGEFEAALGELAKAYAHTGGTTDYFWRAGGTAAAQVQRPGRGAASPDDTAAAADAAVVVGPFLDDEGPAYADCIVGAWLKMCQTSMPPEEWARVRGWHGGLWGRIVDALDERGLCEIK